MATEIDTADDHEDLFERLLAFLQLGITTPGGPDWTMIRRTIDTGASINSALFVAPGLSGLEQIHFGMNLSASSSADAYAIGFWMFRSFNDALGDFEQPGYSGIGYWPLWNFPMKYWLIANAQRLMVVAKVSTVYSASYVGRFLPYGTPGEYAQPYYIGNAVDAATTRWSTLSESNRNFWDPGSEGNILLPSGQWRTVQNFSESSGEADTSGMNVWPYQGVSFDSSTKTEYRRLRENVDGTYPLWPLILNGSSPTADMYGELDGAFAVTGFNNATENLVTQGGIDHLVVQNMGRAARYAYAALKLE